MTQKAASRKTAWEFVTSPSRTLPDQRSRFVIVSLRPIRPPCFPFNRMEGTIFCEDVSMFTSRTRLLEKLCASLEHPASSSVPSECVYMCVSSSKRLPGLVCSLFFKMTPPPHLSCYDPGSLPADVNVLYDYMVCIWEMHCTCIILKTRETQMSPFFVIYKNK